MNAPFDDVSCLHSDKETWRILVKVIRIWYSQGFTNSKLPLSLDMVVVDKQGTKIHVNVKKTLMYKFERNLVDGKVYSISLFDVVENTGEYKTTRHDFKINFQFKTEVRPMDPTLISAEPFSFVSFTDILSPNYDTSFLVDVIGILTGVGTEREIESHGKKTKMNVIELDSDGVKIECTLFGSYVDELNHFFGDGDKVNVVVLLQFAKVKTFQGNITLQNVHGATKLIFNPPYEFANELRQRLSDTNDSGSQSLSQLQDSSKLSGEDDFLILTCRRTLANLNDKKEHYFCIVLATVSYIEGLDWWYTACKCNRKVYADEKMYFCEGCNRHIVTVYPRYRLQVRVVDDTADASLVLFDKEATILIGKPCSELVETVDKNEIVNGLPIEIASLVGKKFLFKLEVKGTTHCRFEPSYRVKRICADQSVIDNFVSAQLDNTVVVTSSSLMTTPTSNLKSVDVTKDLLDDFVIVSGDKSPSTSDSRAIDLNCDTQDIIQGKRVSPEVEELQSGNTKKKKLPVRIKKEKM